MLRDPVHRPEALSIPYHRKNTRPSRRTLSGVSAPIVAAGCIDTQLPGRGWRRGSQ
jgi:hypothetical protein